MQLILLFLSIADVVDVVAAHVAAADIATHVDASDVVAIVAASPVVAAPTAAFAVAIIFIFLLV